MAYLFTTESVSEGHPDKVSDQISDAILDAMLAQDPNSRVAVETLCTTGLVVVSGEVRTNAYVDVQETARQVIRDIGYTRDEGYYYRAGKSYAAWLKDELQDLLEQSDRLELVSGERSQVLGNDYRHPVVLAAALRRVEVG